MATNLSLVTKVEFLAAVNPPVNQKAVLDGGSAVTAIGDLNGIRAATGLGHGPDWVRIRPVGANADPDSYAQLSRVSTASFANAGSGEFAILKRNGEVLGEVHHPDAVHAVHVKFP